MGIRSVIADWLWVAVRPAFWLSNYPTSDELSQFINEALDQGCVPEALSGHTIGLRGRTLWAANYPYAYGHPYSPTVRILPSNRTRARLYKAVIAADLSKWHGVTP